MTEPTITSERFDEDAPAKPRSAAKRAVVYGTALVLLAIAIVVAARGAGDQWAHLKNADPMDVAGMLALVAASVLLNGWILWVMVKPFERGSAVGLGEMTALVGATCVLNYAMRAGLISRAGYLKQRHGIGYRASVVMMLMLAATTVFIYVLMAGVTLWRGGIDAAWCAAVAIGLAALAVLVIPGTRLVLRRFEGEITAWFSAAEAGAVVWVFLLLVARAIDLGFTAGRLWLAGRVFGTPIEYHAAMVMAAGGMLVTVATPLPQGLGVRDALYGLMAEVGVAGDALPSGAKGVALGLIDRAAEAVVFITAGLISLAWLHRKNKHRPPRRAR